MDRHVISNYRQPTILIISNDNTELPLSSTIVALFARLQVAFREQKTLSWIQQHQPDLVMLDLEESEILPLITILKLDWLTRDIPIIAIAKRQNRQLCCSAGLNYDACFFRPYSVDELEQKICSLVPNCDCQLYDKAVQS